MFEPFPGAVFAFIKQELIVQLCPQANQAFGLPGSCSPLKARHKTMLVSSVF